MSKSLLKEIRGKWENEGFQKYFKNTSWALFGRIFSLGISFLTTIYVIRHLGPDNYGLLTFSVSFVGLFAFIATLGIDNILYKELSKNLERKDELLGTSLFLKILASVIAIIFISISTYLIKYDDVTKLLILINSFTLFFASFGIIGYFFQANIQYKYQAISLILVTLILSSLKILVILFDKGIIYFSFVFFLENILYALIGIYFYTISGNNIFNWKLKKTIAFNILRDSWPLMLSSALVVIYTKIDQVMLKFITNDFNVGIYDAAARISEVWYFIPALITNSIFPAIINSQKVGKEFFEMRLTKLYSLMFYMSICVALPVSLLSHQIIRAIYGNNFIQGAGVLGIYVWAGVPVFLTIAINTYLLSENKTKVLFVGSLIGTLTNILLNFWFIPIYGIYGAATATLISYSLIPLSTLLFKETRVHNLLIKNGILYPFILLINLKYRTIQKD